MGAHRIPEGAGRQELGNGGDNNRVQYNPI
jgi:hypothetical protein